MLAVIGVGRGYRSPGVGGRLLDKAYLWGFFCMQAPTGNLGKLVA